LPHTHSHAQTQVTAMALIAAWFSQQRQMTTEKTHLLNAK
jgi:hypothetical protein